MKKYISKGLLVALMGVFALLGTQTAKAQTYVSIENLSVTSPVICYNDDPFPGSFTFKLCKLAKNSDDIYVCNGSYVGTGDMSNKVSIGQSDKFTLGYTSTNYAKGSISTTNFSGTMTSSSSAGCLSMSGNTFTFTHPSSHATYTAPPATGSNPGYIKYNFTVTCYYRNFGTSTVKAGSTEVEFYRFNYSQVQPAVWKDGSVFGGPKDKTLNLYPNKPGTTLSGVVKNSTCYRYRIIRPDGSVVKDWSDPDNNEQISWNPYSAGAGSYKIEVVFYRRDASGNINVNQPWYRSQADPIFDTLKADLLILGAFGVAGPLGTNCALVADKTYTYYYDTMPYFRIDCEGFDLVPGETFIEGKIFRGAMTNNVVVAQEYINRNEQLANGWTISESNWDWNKVNATTYLLAHFWLKQNEPDGEGGFTEKVLAESNDFRFYVMQNGPDVKWYTKQSQTSTLYEPKSFYTPNSSGNALAVGVKNNTDIELFGGGHGALRVVYTLKDLKTGNLVEGPTMLAQTSQQYIIQNLPNSIFTTAGGHYEARFHFKRVFDGGGPEATRTGTDDCGGYLVDFDEMYDLVNDFWVMNQPTSNITVDVNTAASPYYNNGDKNEYDFEKFAIFYGDPVFGVKPNDASLPLGTGAGQYSVRAVTGNSCLFFNLKGSVSSLTQKTDLPFTAPAGSYGDVTWTVGNIPEQPCKVDDGHGFKNLEADKVTCRYGVYFHLVYHVEDNDAGVALKPKTDEDIRNVVHYFELMPAEGPCANPVATASVYAPGDPVVINYNVTNFHRDNKGSQGHGRMRIGYSKDGGAAGNWGTPTTNTTVWEQSGLPAGNYEVYFSFEIIGHSSGSWTQIHCDTVRFSIMNNPPMPEVTFTTDKAPQIAEPASWFEPVTVILSIPSVSGAPIKYSTDGTHYSDYTAPLTLETTTTIWAYGAAKNPYTEGTPVSHTYTVDNLDPQLTSDLAAHTADFGTVYSASKEITFNLKHKGLLDAINDGKGTLNFEISAQYGIVATYFALESPATTTRVDRATSLTELPVTVKYTKQAQTDVLHQAKLTVTHTSITGKVLTYEITLKATSGSCGAPAQEDVSVNAKGTFAELNISNGSGTYKYKYGTSTNLNSATEHDATGNTILLEGLTTGTPYYYEISSVCGDAQSDYGDQGSFTSASPVVNLSSPQQNQKFEGDASVAFTVDNFTIGTDPATPTAPYYPYGTAKVEILDRNDDNSVKFTQDNATGAAITASLPTGLYTAKVTLTPVTYGTGTIEAASLVKTQPFEVDLPNMDKPGLSIAAFTDVPSIVDGTIVYDSAELTITCGTEGALVEYSLDGGSTWTVYDATKKPHIKSEDGTNKTVSVKAKASKTGMDNSDEASATYTVRPVYNVANARALYADEYASYVAEGAPTASTRFFRITGEETVVYADYNCHNNSGARRIYVQDKDGKGLSGERSIVLYPAVASNNVSITGLNRGDIIKNIIGQLSKSGPGLLSFIPVNRALERTAGSPANIWVDTVRAEDLYPYGAKKKYHSGLVCIKYEKFPAGGGNFTMGLPVTLQCGHASNHDVNLRPDFYDADYVGTAIPTSGKKYFITGMVMFDEPLSRILPRDGNDIKEAPFVDITTDDTNLEEIYGKTAVLANGKVEFGNHTGVPEMELVKNTNSSFALDKSDVANGNFSVTYTFRSAYGKDTAWLVARYAEVTDTLKVWAESKECMAPVSSSPSNTEGQSVTLGITGNADCYYVRFDVESTDGVWPSGSSVVSTTTNTVEITGLNYNTTYNYKVRGVCAVYGEGDEVKSPYLENKSFKTNKEEGMSIALTSPEADVTINTTDITVNNVHVAYTYSNVNIVAGDNASSRNGSVRLRFYDYTGNTRGALLGEKITTAASYDTFLLTGKYLVEAYLLQLDGTEFEEDDRATAATRVFSVQLPDAANPVIEVASTPTPIYITVDDVKQYWDSVDVQITCPGETGATIKYTVNGGEEKTYSAPFRIHATSAISARSIVNRKDDGHSNASIVILTDPETNFRVGGNHILQNKEYTTLTWSTALTEAGRGEWTVNYGVDNLRADVSVQVKPQTGSTAGIKLKDGNETIKRNSVGKYTGGGVLFEPAVSDLRVGAWHDTILFIYKGKEVNRAVINLTVKAFEIPAVTITPGTNITPGYQRTSPEIKMEVLDAENTAATYEIHYTTDGTTPTLSSTKYTEPFTLSNTTDASKDITVKALAFHNVAANADTTKEENLTEVTYRLYNPVEIVHSHSNILDTAITTNQQLSLNVTHTAKYLTSEVNIWVVKKNGQADAALQVSPTSVTPVNGNADGDAINFTVTSKANLMPGTYQDTVKIMSVGKVLCSKVVNLKVTSFRVPGATIMPVSNTRSETSQEVTMTVNGTSSNLNPNETHRKGYFITYTTNGDKPTVDSPRYTGPVVISNTDVYSRSVTVKAMVWDPTGKDTTDKNAVTEAKYILYNNPAITTGPKEVSYTTLTTDADIADNELSYVLQYLSSSYRLNINVKPKTGKTAGIKLGTGEGYLNGVGNGEPQPFTLHINRVSTDTGTFQDTLIFTENNNNKVIYKTVVNLRTDYPELPDMDPVLRFESEEKDFGHIYEEYVDANFNLQYRDLYDDKKDREDKGTVTYTLVGADKDYFTLVIPDPTPVTYDFDKNTLHDTAVKVRYSFQSSDLGTHKAGLAVAHKHVVKGWMRDTIWFTAESRTCPVPVVTKVEDSVTFATITFNGDDASKFVMSYATSNEDLLLQNSPNRWSKTVVNDHVFELSGLKANTTYYYRVKGYCTENVTSSGFEITTFTTSQPAIDLRTPGDNTVYTGDVEVEFTVANYHLGTQPEGLTGKHLPYGKAKVELLKGDDVLAQDEENISGKFSYFLTSGNYTARITLLPDNAAATGSQAVKEQAFKVDLPDVATPTISVEPLLIPSLSANTHINGNVIYDSAELTLACDTPGVTFWYSFNGTDYTQYDPANKPHVVSPTGANANVQVWAKATKAKRDPSVPAEAAYEVRPLYKVSSAAALYAYYDGLSEEYAPGFADKYFQINGNLVVTHTDSSETTKRRIYVQDEGGKFEDGKRSLVIRILSSHDKISVKNYHRSDMLQQGIIGQMVKNQNFLRFLPVNEPIGIQSSGHYVHVDTLELATIKANKTMFHGDLACVTYVKFNDESDELKEKFLYDQFYTMTCRHGVDMRFRTDFKHADYLEDSMKRPEEDKYFFITGILTQAVDHGVDRARITPRDKNDIVEAPYVDITTANRNLGVLYANTAKVDAALKYGNYEGEPVLTLVKNTRGFNLGTPTMADGTGSFTVTYEYQSEAGKDTAWVVAKYAYGDITDTLKVWAESRLCPDVEEVTASGASEHEITLDFSGHYVAYEVEYRPQTTPESEWLKAVTEENESSLTLKELTIGTTYQYAVKGVCANYPGQAITQVNSVNPKTGTFNTVAEGAMRIALKEGKPADNAGDVEIAFSVRNFELADEPSVENGQHGKVRLSIFRYEDNVAGDTVVKEFIQDSVYTTVLSTGRYMVSVLLVDKDGEMFPDGNIDAIRSQRAFNVKWPDVDRPAIAVTGEPVFVTINKETKYYDSVDVEITCPDNKAALFYSLDGSEPSTAYTRGTTIRIKKAGLTTMYAKSVKERHDSGYDTLAVSVVTNPINFIHTDGDSVYSYTLTTLSWTDGFNHGYDIDVDSLRADMTMEVRPGGEKPAIKINRSTLPRNRNAYRTSHTINVYAADPLVGAGTYHDTIVISTQGRELSRIQVNITVKAFTVPKVNITPRTKEHQREVKVAMKLASAPENTKAAYEIHYTLDGSLPTRELVPGKCLKYEDTITLTNEDLPSMDYKVKALAFHMVDFNRDTTKDANVDSVLFTLINPVEHDESHEAVFDTAISVIEHLSRVVEHKVKYLTGEVTVRVAKRASDAAVAVKVSPTVFPAASTEIIFTVSETEGLRPGSYQDTIQLWHAGKVLCYKIVNLKVTSFRVPKVKITPVETDHEDELTIRMSCTPIEHTGAVYEIHYTYDGSEPTRDLVPGKCFKYTGPIDTTQLTVGEKTIHIKALAFDMTQVDTTCASDSLAEITYNLSHRIYPTLKINPRPEAVMEEGFYVDLYVDVTNAYLKAEGSHAKDAQIWVEIYDNGALNFNKFIDSKQILSAGKAEFNQYDVENSMLGGFYAGHTYKFRFTLQKLDGTTVNNRFGQPITDSCTIEIVEPGTLPRDYAFDWIEAPDTVDIWRDYTDFYFSWKVKDNTGNGVPDNIAIIAELYNKAWQEPLLSNVEIIPDEHGLFVMNDTLVMASDNLNEGLLEQIVPGDYTLKLYMFEVEGAEEEGSAGKMTMIGISTKDFTVIRPTHPYLAFNPEPDSVYEEDMPFTIDVKATNAYFHSAAGHNADAYARLSILKDGTEVYNEEAYMTNYNVAEMHPNHLEDHGFEGFKKDHTYTLTFTLYHKEDGTVWLGYKNVPVTASCTFKVVEQGSLPKAYEFDWQHAPTIINIYEGFDELLFTWKIKNNTDEEEIPDNIFVTANMYNDNDKNGNTYNWPLYNAWVEPDAAGLYTIDSALLAQEEADFEKITEGNYTLVLDMIEVIGPYEPGTGIDFNPGDQIIINRSTKKFVIFNRDPEDIPEPVKLPSVKFEPAGGDYNDSVWVTLSCDSTSAAIYYRTASGAAFELYKGAFKLTDTTTVEAFAHMDDVMRINSDTSDATYYVADTWVAPEPVKLPSVKFTPEPGIEPFRDSVFVKLSHDSSAAKIYYRTYAADLAGSKEAAGEFTLYTDSVKLTSISYVEAFATMGDDANGGNGALFTNSDTLSRMYIVLKNGEEIEPVKLPSVVVSPDDSVFTDSVRVSLTCSYTAAAIYYRTSEDSAFGLYTGSFKLTDTATVEAFAHIDGGLFINSDTVARNFYVAPKPTEPEAVKLPSVVVSPDGGEFTDSVRVSLSCENTSAEIYYRTSATAAFGLYTGSFKLTETSTVEAFASMDGERFLNSDTCSVLFTKKADGEIEYVKLPSVKFAPESGIYEDSVMVVLSHDSASARIYYRSFADRSQAGAFRLYTEAVKLTATATVEAFASMDGGRFLNSDTTAVWYTVVDENSEPVKLPSVVISPNGGRFDDSVWVELGCAATNADIYYRTSASAFGLYAGPFKLTVTTVVEAFAHIDNEMYVNSDTSEALFRLTSTSEEPVKLPNVIFRPDGGRFDDSVWVELSCDNYEADIYFRVEPGAAYKLYTEGFWLKRDTVTVEAFAHIDAEIYLNSDTLARTFFVKDNYVEPETGLDLVKIYPNPTLGEFHVLVPDGADVDIFTVHGAYLGSEYNVSGIRTYRLNPGEYFVRVRLDGEKKVKRVIVK